MLINTGDRGNQYSGGINIERLERPKLAELLADQKIQQERAEKRLRGVREGGGKARKSSTSWSDIAAEYAADQETS